MRVMKKTLLVLILVSAAVVGVWKLRSHSAPAEATESTSVLDRIWVDHIPRSDKDVFQLFVALTEQPVGIFQATSQWKGSYEVFRYESNGNEIRALYPQTNEKEKFKVSAKPCKEKGMDYCLELDGASRGVKRYYSLEGWEIDHAATVDDIHARVETLVHVVE
jgi:hypothetical protein